jgi:hypothetical protein
MEIIIACKNDKEKTGRLRLLKRFHIIMNYMIGKLNGVSISTESSDHLFCPDSILRIHAA